MPKHNLKENLYSCFGRYEWMKKNKINVLSVKMLQIHSALRLAIKFLRTKVTAMLAALS